MVPRGPSSRPREKPRGGFPHWILLPENGRCGTGDERSVAKRTDAGATAAPAFSEGRSPLRCIKGHPEKQTTIAKLIQSRQADIQHPLVYRRTYAPFASAPCAPGVQGITPAALFPRFLSRQRNRAAGGNPPAGVNAARVTPHQALRASCLAAARSGAALTCHRHVIHSRAPASQPQGKPGCWPPCVKLFFFAARFPSPVSGRGIQWGETAARVLPWPSGRDS